MINRSYSLNSVCFEFARILKIRSFNLHGFTVCNLYAYKQARKKETMYSINTLSLSKKQTKFSEEKKDRLMVN